MGQFSLRKEMASSERQKKDEELLKHELEQTTAKPLLLETVQQMKDSRQGVSTPERSGQRSSNAPLS
jgi:hypothetical protein